MKNNRALRHVEAKKFPTFISTEIQTKTFYEGKMTQIVPEIYPNAQCHP